MDILIYLFREYISKMEKNFYDAYMEEADIYLSPHSQEERRKHMKLAFQMTLRNLKTFNIDKGKRQKYQSSNLEKLELDDGWFVNLTDNKVNSPHTFLTFHGTPGSHVEWAPLENETAKLLNCRWINLVLPGFDNIDERRGSYTGTIQQIMKLIVDTLDLKGIQQVILVAHSYGNFIASLFIHHYKHRVQGYISMSVNYLNTGLQALIRLAIMETYLGIEKSKEHELQLLNDEEYRLKRYATYQAGRLDFNFHGGHPPPFSQTAFIAFLKLNTSMEKGPLQFVQFTRAVKMFRVFVYGADDPIFNFEESSQHILSNLGKACLPSNAEKQVQEAILSKFGVKIPFNKIQQYFCFGFGRAGHNPFYTKCQELSKILSIYVGILDIISPFVSLQKTKL